MTTRRIRAKVESIRDLTPEVREMTLRLIDPPDLHFHSGQSISIEIPASRFSKSLIRHYSLASPPSQSKSLVLLVNAGSQGVGSTYLLKQQVHDEVCVSGPYGTFHLHDDAERDMLFVATGSGIAPFRSMLYALSEHSMNRAVTLFWGLRREQDVYYQEELRALSQRHKNFSYQVVLSQSQKDWIGAKGRVTHLVENISSVKNLAVYICGNRRMVTEVTQIVQKKGDCPIYRE